MTFDHGSRVGGDRRSNNPGNVEFSLSAEEEIRVIRFQSEVSRDELDREMSDFLMP